MYICKVKCRHRLIKENFCRTSLFTNGHRPCQNGCFIRADGQCGKKILALYIDDSRYLRKCNLTYQSTFLYAQALVDMLASFADLVALSPQTYSRPILLHSTAAEPPKLYVSLLSDESIKALKF